MRRRISPDAESLEFAKDARNSNSEKFLFKDCPGDFLDQVLPLLLVAPRLRGMQFGKGCCSPSAHTIQQILVCGKLEKLEIYYYGLCDAFASVIEGLQASVYVRRLSCPVHPRLLKALDSVTSLHKLKILHLEIEADAAHLEEADVKEEEAWIKIFPFLTETYIQAFEEEEAILLDYFRQRVTPLPCLSGITFLLGAKLIKETPTVLGLSMVYGPIRAGDNRAGGFELLCSALESPQCTLEYLQVKLFTTSQMAMLFEASAQSPHLQSLSVLHIDFIARRTRSRLLNQGQVQTVMLLFTSGLQTFEIIGHVFVLLHGLLKALESAKLTLRHFKAGSLSKYEFNAVLQKIVAYLESNFQCPLETLDLVDEEEELKYCRQILERNKLYRQGGLGKQEQVEPFTAKLFICGDSRVGKSTIRRNLTSNLVTCFRTTLQSTFGIDMAALNFPGGKKLVICDLAGQPEFHGFHHYFVRGSDKDLFLIVCKYPGSVDEQLSYWLRFLASHRTMAERKTRVMILVNFFPDPTRHEWKVPALTNAAKDLCRSSIDKFSNYISFHNSGSELLVYGAVAQRPLHVRRAVKPAIEMNLGELLQSRPKIPTICKRLSGTLPVITRNRRDKVMSVEELRTRFDPNVDKMLLEVSLKFLHDMGEVIFFDEQQKEVILDVQWFVRDVIGVFLPRLSREGSLAQIQKSNGELEEGIVYDELGKQGCKPNATPYVRTCLSKLGVLLDDHPEKYKVTVLSFLPEKNTFWPSYTSTVEKFMYWGRRLECKDTSTLLPSGVCAMLQVELAKKFKYQEVGRGWINLMEDGIGVVVKVGGSNDSWYDRHWIDMLVGIPSDRQDDVYLDKAEQALIKVKDCARTVCGSYNWGCPLLELVEKVIQPQSVMDMTCSNVDVLTDVVQEAKEQDLDTYKHTWKKDLSRPTPLYQLLLPSEREAQRRQSWKKLESVRAAAQIAADAIANDRVEYYGDEPEYARRLSHEMKEMRKDLRSIRDAVERLEQTVRTESRELKTQGNLMLRQLLVNTTLRWPKYPYILEEESNQLQKLTSGRRYKLRFCCEYCHQYRAREPDEAIHNYLVHEVPQAQGFIIKAGPDWLDKDILPVLDFCIRTVFLSIKVVAAVIPPANIASVVAEAAEGPLIKALKSKTELNTVLSPYTQEFMGFRVRATDGQRDKFFKKLKEDGLDEGDFEKLFGLKECTRNGITLWLCEKHS